MEIVMLETGLKPLVLMAAIMRCSPSVGAALRWPPVWHDDCPCSLLAG